MTLKANFWKNKKVLITGHTGFKGSWLTMVLNELGSKIVGVSLEPNTTPSLFHINKLDTICKSNIFNIKDYSNLCRLVSDHKPEVIFHMAAQSIVKESYKDPVNTFETNIIGSEPKGAPSMFESLKKNRLVKLEKIDRFVDGIAVKKVGNFSFDYCKKYLDDIIILDENEICNSMLELKHFENITTEPAGAMSSASLWYYKEKIIGKNVGCIICGGNNDNSRMPEIIERADIWKSNNPEN